MDKPYDVLSSEHPSSLVDTLWAERKNIPTYPLSLPMSKRPAREQRPSMNTVGGVELDAPASRDATPSAVGDGRRSAGEDLSAPSAKNEK